MPLEVTGTLDIETESWDRFVVGGILTPEGFECFEWRDEDEYIDFLLDCHGTYWGFNAGRFDFLHIIEHLRKRDISDAKCFTAGQRITLLRYKDLTLRDAAAISGPMNLRQFAEIGGVPKRKTGLACQCGECDDPQNGYCRIRRDMSRKDLDTLISYLKYDCLSLKSALLKLSEFCDEQSIILKGTIGASAFATIKQWTGLGNSEWSRSKDFNQYLAIRNGYYGGRTQLFQPGRPSTEAWTGLDEHERLRYVNHRPVDHGYRYDINSAYPAALANLELPMGNVSRVAARAARRVFDSGRSGIYRCKVKVHCETFIPPLPYRFSDRVGYPTGTFEGAWTRHELDYALETGDVEILKFGDAYTFHEAQPILRPFCGRIWGLRDREGTKSGLGRWLKNLGNSASGKFAQRPEVDEVLLGPDDFQDACEPTYRTCSGTNCYRHQFKGCCIHSCFGLCGVMLPLGESRWIYTRKVFRLAPAGFVHWAAYLTSYARVELHRQLTDDGDGGRTAIYCDTDSCYAATPRTRNLDEHRLGYWKYEGELYDWHGIAPKTYAYFADDEETHRRELHARSKGIPDAEKNWSALSTGKPVRVARGVATLKSAAKLGSLFVRKDMERALHADGVHFGDRILRSDGRTYPPFFDGNKPELEKHIDLVREAT